MVNIFLICTVALLSAVVATMIVKYGRLAEELEALETSYSVLSTDHSLLEHRHTALLSQKKSSEVRTGQIAEQMAPFLDGFPYDPKKSSFLGNPVDFVVFDDDGVHFVEVKSGAAQLSSKQRRIRDTIKEGSVTFEVYRVKGNNA